MTDHGIEQLLGPADVVAKVLAGFSLRFGHFNVSSQMQDGVASGQHAVEHSGIAHIPDHQFGSGVNGLGPTPLQVVHHNHLVPRIKQMTDSDRTYVAGATSDQYLHDLATGEPSASRRWFWSGATSFNPNLRHRSPSVVSSSAVSTLISSAMWVTW